MSPPTVDETECTGVLQVVGELTGLTFVPHRRSTADEAIGRGMARAGVANIDDYRRLLGDNPQVLDELVGEITIGETYFLREPRQFDFIRQTVLSEFQQRQPAGRAMRLWSAGCASGEEAYSLAIVCAEAGLGDRTQIVATDISRAALARAAEAEYREWSLRGEGAATARAYLRQQGENYVVAERIRRLVVFQYLNLALDEYPSFAAGIWGLDLILCRNVLIYFHASAIERVADRLFRCLTPGGWLITSSSDPPLAPHAPFEVVETEMGLFYRRPTDIQHLAVHSERDENESRFEDEIAASPERPQVSTDETRDTLDAKIQAEEAFACGDYPRAMELTSDHLDDPVLAILHIRAAANVESIKAEQLCTVAVSRHKLVAEMHYLHAVLLLQLGRDEEASQAARRVIYLDRTLAIAHFTLGAALVRLGDAPGAYRAYRNVQRLCTARPAEERVPLADGERAGRLAEAAAAQLALLNVAGSEPT